MRRPSYRLTRSADQDIESILHYTLTKHGPTQTRKYSNQIEICLDTLSHEKGQIRKLSSIHPALLYLHCQHHYIFGLKHPNQPMLIIALLHERMDFIRQLTDRLEPPPNV